MTNIKNRLAQNPRLWLSIAAAVGLVVALPLRVWQQLLLVEDYTGFWFDASHPSIIVLYIFMALPVVLSLTMAVLMHKSVTVDLARRPRKIEGYASLAAALLVFISSVLVFLQAVSGDIATFVGVLEGIFGLGFVAFLANLGLVNLFPTGKAYLSRVLTLMPLLWVIARLLGYFSRTISYLRVSDLFINIAAAALLLVFFMAAAQILAGVNAEKKAWRMAAFGLPAAALLLLAFLPRLIAAPFVDVHPSQDAVLDLANLGVAVFIGVFMITRLRSKTAEEIAAEEEAALVEQAMAEEPAVEAAPVQIAVAEEVPAQAEMPAQETAIEETPAQEAKIEEALAQATLIEESAAPVEEIAPPVQDAPLFEEQVNIEEI